jgi:large subunit ribosomal protein L3
MTRVIKGTELVPVTLVKVPTVKVVQIKTLESDGYTAVVLGIQSSDEASLKEGKKAMSANEFSTIREVRVSEEDLAKYNVGDEITLEQLEEVAEVKVIGTSKGKGFAGAMKRHNFHGGPASHGSKFHRALGSIGNRKPTRTHKGKKMHGHMGNERITLKKIGVELVNKDLRVVGLRGPIPGARNSLVVLEF